MNEFQISHCRNLNLSSYSTPNRLPTPHSWCIKHPPSNCNTPNGIGIMSACKASKKTTVAALSDYAHTSVEEVRLTYYRQRNSNASLLMHQMNQPASLQPASTSVQPYSATSVPQDSGLEMYPHNPVHSIACHEHVGAQAKLRSPLIVQTQMACQLPSQRTACPPKSALQPTLPESLLNILRDPFDLSSLFPGDSAEDVLKRYTPPANWKILWEGKNKSAKEEGHQAGSKSVSKFDMAPSHVTLILRGADFEDTVSLARTATVRSLRERVSEFLPAAASKDFLLSFGSQILKDSQTLKSIEFSDYDQVTIRFLKSTLKDLPIWKATQFSVCPSIDTLRQMTEIQLAAVNEFTIGNQYGKIEFEGKTDVREVDLDSVVRITQKCVEVYPSTKPPIGQGLNKPARITLYECHSRRNAQKFEAKLRSACLARGHEFIQWCPTSGHWTFRVLHFL